MSNANLNPAFLAPILRLPDGMRFHYLPLPMDVAEAFLAAGVRRVLATINGHTVGRGIQGRHDGERYLILGQALLRDLGVALGDMVPVELIPDPNPDDVDLPEALVAALDQDEEAATRFYGMTPGKRRSLAHYVSSAKRPDTRIRRALELAHKLRTFTLHSDKKSGS